MGYSREKADEVYRALVGRGFDYGLCQEIAYNHMNTDWTATRMLGYLYGHSEVSEAMVVDEMIAILEDRERFRHKHEAEEANAAITEYYNSDLRG